MFTRTDEAFGRLDAFSKVVRATAVRTDTAFSRQPEPFDFMASAAERQSLGEHGVGLRVSFSLSPVLIA